MLTQQCHHSWSQDMLESLSTMNERHHTQIILHRSNIPTTIGNVRKEDHNVNKLRPWCRSILWQKLPWFEEDINAVLTISEIDEDMSYRTRYRDTGEVLSLSRSQCNFIRITIMISWIHAQVNTLYHKLIKWKHFLLP